MSLFSSLKYLFFLTGILRAGQAEAVYDSFAYKQGIEFAELAPIQFLTRQQTLLQFNETEFVNSKKTEFSEIPLFPSSHVAVFLEPDCNKAETCSLEINLPPEVKVNCVTPDLCGQSTESVGKILFHPVRPYARFSISHPHTEKPVHLWVLERALSEAAHSEDPVIEKRTSRFCDEESESFIARQQYPSSFCHRRATGMTSSITMMTTMTTMTMEDEFAAEEALLPITVYRGSPFEHVSPYPLVPGIISDGEAIEPAWFNQRRIAFQEPGSVNASLLFVQAKGNLAWHDRARLRRLISRWPSLPDEVKELNLRLIDNDHWLFHKQGPLIWRSMFKNDASALEVYTPQGWQTATPDLLEVIDAPWYETLFWKWLFDCLDSGGGPYGYDTPNNMALAALFERWRMEENQEHRKQKKDRRKKPVPTPLLPPGTPGKQAPYQHGKKGGKKGQPERRGQPVVRHQRAGARYQTDHGQYRASALSGTRKYSSPACAHRKPNISKPDKCLLEHGFKLLQDDEGFQVALDIANQLLSSHGSGYWEFQQMVQLKIRACCGMGSFGEAVEFYEKVKDNISFPTMDLRLAWAKALEGIGKTDEAVKILQELYQRINTKKVGWECQLSKFGLALIRAYQKNQMLSEALSLGNELTRRLPQDPKVILAVVRVMECMHRFDLNKEASEMLERAMPVHPKNEKLQLAYVTLHLKWLRIDPERMSFTESVVNQYARMHPHNAEFTKMVSQLEAFKTSGEPEIAIETRRLFNEMTSTNEPSADLLEESEKLLGKCPEDSPLYPLLKQLKAEFLYRLRRLDECIEFLDGITPMQTKLAFIKAKALQERASSPEDRELAVWIFNELFREIDGKLLPKEKKHTGQALHCACSDSSTGQSLKIRQKAAEELNIQFPDDYKISIKLIKIYEEQGTESALRKAKDTASRALDRALESNNESDELRMHLEAINKALWHNGPPPRVWFGGASRFRMMQAVKKADTNPLDANIEIADIMEMHDPEFCLNHMDILELYCQALYRCKLFHDCFDIINRYYPDAKLSASLMHLKGACLFKKEKQSGDLTETLEILEKSYKMSVKMKDKLNTAEMLGHVLFAINTQEAIDRAQQLFLELWKKTRNPIFEIEYAGALARSKVPGEAETGRKNIDKLFTGTIGHNRKQDMVWAGILHDLEDWVKFDQLQLHTKYPDNHPVLLRVSMRYTKQLRSMDPDQDEQFCDVLKNAIDYAMLALKVDCDDSGTKKQLINCYVVLKNHPEYYEKFHFNNPEEIQSCIGHFDDSMKKTNPPTR